MKIVNGENGILINERSPHEIVQAITYLSEDPILSTTIARKARKTVEEKFDFRKNIEQLYNIFVNNINAIN